jgi:hypothetical protein
MSVQDEEAFFQQIQTIIEAAVSSISMTLVEYGNFYNSLLALEIIDEEKKNQVFLQIKEKLQPRVTTLLSLLETIEESKDVFETLPSEYNASVLLPSLRLFSSNYSLVTSAQFPQDIPLNLLLDPDKIGEALDPGAQEFIKGILEASH